MERYIGLDAHGASCTFAVIGQSGKKLRQDVIETNGAALINYLRTLPGADRNSKRPPRSAPSYPARDHDDGTRPSPDARGHLGVWRRSG